MSKVIVNTNGLLYGMTLIYQDRWYDITIDNGEATVEEV